MDQTTEAVRAFLVSMEPVREALRSLVRRPYERPSVKFVRIYDPLAFPSSDFGVSVELHSGAVVDFWLELTFNNAGWQLEHSVLRHDADEDGSHPEVSFPEQTIYAAAELPKAILVAIGQLQEAGESADLYR